MAYDQSERREVRRQKKDEYGGRETFAVPSLDSYPLTKNGKPDEERTRAAWDYIHVAENREKLGDDAGKAERRIRAFAKKHFPDMALEGAKVRKSLGEVYLFRDENSGALPLTRGGVPDGERVQKAWDAIHRGPGAFTLGEQAVEAERRLRWFAERYKIALPDA